MCGLCSAWGPKPIAPDPTKAAAGVRGMGGGRCCIRKLVFSRASIVPPARDAVAVLT